MIEYVLSSYDKIFNALIQHIELVITAVIISIIMAAIITVIAMYCRVFGTIITDLFSVIYSIPSLALFAILIPLTGLGFSTAIIVLIAYNQYLLLGNFIPGLRNVAPSVVEAATGMGMTPMQILIKIRIPLSIGAIITGIKLAVVSTVGIGTIAALINAGGLGELLLDGMRTMNVYKIVCGCVLAAGMAIILNSVLSHIERKFKIDI